MPAGAVGLGDLIRNRPNFDGGDAGEFGGAEHAEAFHGLNIAVARATNPGAGTDRERHGIGKGPLRRSEQTRRGPD